jgi:hypothetical protein
MPFMTTYKCRNGEYNASNAVWVVEKHPNQEYYYIKHANSGKYLTFNVAMGNSSNAGRMRVHLEAAPADENDALFEIVWVADKSCYDIKTKKSGADNANRKFINVTDGNKAYLVANGKTDGPNKMAVGGIIGLWTSGSASDNNSKWYLESATIAKPTITNNFDGTFTIQAEAGATIYYTTDGTTPTTSTPTSGTSSVNVSQTESLTVIKAIAHKAGDPFPSGVTIYSLPVCERPVITVEGNTVTITCATPGATIHYTTSGSVTSSSPTYTGPFSLGDATFVKAIATKAGYCISSEAVYSHTLTVHSSSEIDEMSGRYILASDFVSTSAIGTASAPFRGIIDGQMNTLSNLDHPLVAYANGAIIKNVILDNISISGGTNVGAICNETTGDTRIYNCGVLATGSTVEKDADGYDYISSCSSTISGSGYVGGIVGLLDGSSRVINCFNYANVSGGSYVGGIVGYNAVATTAVNLKTMVMNCMFYGEVSGTSIAPIYNGEKITNVGDGVGVSNFNYFRLESSYIQNTTITKVYNCSLGAETRFLQRFEFFRYLLNSNRELAAWWATGYVADKDEMMKWVMEPSQIGTATPYPILKTPDKYASVVNYTPSETAYDEGHRNEGSKLTSMGTNGQLAVTIQMGSGGAQYTAPSGARLKSGVASSFNLTITDKDFEHFNFNYGKVQLPYYNDYCDGNYTENRVVTGWKIVSITGGTSTGYSIGVDVTYAGGTLTATPYNFADRKCTGKDLYGTSGRVFNQGAYWDVPEGVTAITIEPYWGRAVYLADAYYDVVYNNDMTTAYNVPTVGGGQRYDNGVSTFNDQVIYTSMSNAIASTALFSGVDANNHTVYDYAVVLVGNYHHSGVVESSNSKPYTVTSVDLDDDHEPDCSYLLRFDARTLFHPVRYDFLNLIGLGMAQKSTGGTGSYNLGIIQPKAWFEVTNTALFRVTQFEYSPNDRTPKPIILQGGVIEQWVTQQQDAGDRVSYFHVGGNVWFKEFHRGSHQDNVGKKTPHPPVSVTGGDFDKFYLTGLYQSQAAIYDDNAECYINGGRFGEVAGAGMEGIGSSDGKGNVTWVIDHADIKHFFGGGINYAKPVHGNIHTIISNSYVDVFCSGPKFGDMVTDRTVTTSATNCTFGTYFGAGYGGNAYNRYAPKNQINVMNIDWNSWVSAQYTQSYNNTYGGVSAEIDYQFIPMSSNASNVARLWVEYVNFSLATTHDVTSTLTGCTITGNFYGGGSLGKVNGDVTSTLTNCTVNGSVFGAGYSASLPTVEVDSVGFRTEPYYYEDLGTYRTAVKGATTAYTWRHGNAISIDKTNHILYTTADLTALGTVAGKVTLNIEGTTMVFGNVFGGGESSDAKGDVEVNINGGTIKNDVYGGGASANTNTNNVTAGYGTGSETIPSTSTYTTTVNLHGGVIEGKVFGGGLGELPSGSNPGVEAFVYGDVMVKLNEVTASDNCVVKGNIFGCNNLKGTPKGEVTVHVYKTQGWAGHDVTAGKGDDTIEKGTGIYEVAAVYGGGNQAAYVPVLDATETNVIIEGCDLTSIQYVYGGGNAAPVSGSHVLVKSCYEIERVFGGGNGFDNLDDGSPNPGANVGYMNPTYSFTPDPTKSDAENEADRAAAEAAAFEAQKATLAYGSGKSFVELLGGTIHYAFGGSNTKGNVRVSATVKLDEGGTCELEVGEVYGAGNMATQDGTSNILLGCVSFLEEMYGGSRDANINSDIELTIQSGQFHRVFGGNNLGGTISGTITVNIEETGCHPIIIGQLYGGGNRAAYTGPWIDPSDHSKGRLGPTVNVRSFSSIGEIYGGGYGESAIITGNTYVNINECVGENASIETESRTIDGVSKTVSQHTGETVTINAGMQDEVEVGIPLHEAGKIGAIGFVYGGGNAAPVYGNTNITIGTLTKFNYVSIQDDAGTAEDESERDVVGVDIRGNVFGGGNEAEVTGNTNVIIGKE